MAVPTTRGTNTGGADLSAAVTSVDARSATTSVEFALTTARALGLSLSAELSDITSGTSLLALARERDALANERAHDPLPLTGDLVLLEPDHDSDLIVAIIVAPADPAKMPRTFDRAELRFLYQGRVHSGTVSLRPGARLRCRSSRSDAPQSPCPALRTHGVIRVDRL